MFSENEATNGIQHCILNMFKVMIKICDEHKLKYYLCGGTLLGAVRHQGFIPWDDDMDVWMPRKDYEAFIRIADDYLPKGYSVMHYTKIKNSEEPTVRIARVVDDNTILKWTIGDNTREVPAWIDIFALDGMPNGKIRRKLHYFHYRLWSVVMQISFFEKAVNYDEPNRPFHEKIILWFVKTTKLGRGWNTNKLLEKSEKILKKYEFDRSDFIASLHGRFRAKGIFPRNWVAKAVKLPFEDTEFCVPVEYGRILERFYGDYMTLPKTTKEKEKHHEIELVTLDKMAKGSGMCKNITN